MPAKFGSIKFNLMKAFEFLEDMNSHDMNVQAQPSGPDYYKEYEVAVRLNETLNGLLHDGFFDDCEPISQSRSRDDEDYEEEVDEVESDERVSDESSPRSEGFDYGSRSRSHSRSSRRSRGNAEHDDIHRHHSQSSRNSSSRSRSRGRGRNNHHVMDIESSGSIHTFNNSLDHPQGSTDSQEFDSRDQQSDSGSLTGRFRRYVKRMLPGNNGGGSKGRRGSRN